MDEKEEIEIIKNFIEDLKKKKEFIENVIKELNFQWGMKLNALKGETVIIKPKSENKRLIKQIEKLPKGFGMFSDYHKVIKILEA